MLKQVFTDFFRAYHQNKEPRKAQDSPRTPELPTAGGSPGRLEEGWRVFGPKYDAAWPFDASVVTPTVGRQSVLDAVRSVYAQAETLRIQLLIGVDAPLGSFEELIALLNDGPPNVTTYCFYPGYSTSVRHGGLHPARDGGVLRTVLTYLANARYVAYLDDDNWWAPNHLKLLLGAIAGRSWAFSHRWFIHPQTRKVVCEDSWESVGPGKGIFLEKFGGWVDPNCLMLDKILCEPAIRWWSIPLAGDQKAMSADRNVYDFLQRHGPPGEVPKPTVFYAMQADDIIHAHRMSVMGELYDKAGPNSTPEQPSRAIEVIPDTTSQQRSERRDVTSPEGKVAHINNLLAQFGNKNLSEQLATNPKMLLKIPALRHSLARSSLEKAIAKGAGPQTLEGSTAVRTGTLKHNLKMLNAAFLDRGGKLVDALSSLGLLNQDDFGNPRSPCLSPRVLCIGPRNEVELFALIGCGVPIENVHGLDLISYSPFVTIGDMHEIPFPENTFDIVIVGWVLAYSKTPNAVADEIVRVSRDRGVVMIGWDYSAYEFGGEYKTLVSAETSRISSSFDIEELFGDHVANTIIRREARYPFGDEDRKIVYAFTLAKDGSGGPRRLRNLEAAFVDDLARQYSGRNLLTEESAARFSDHADFAHNFEARAGTEGIGYRVMRSQFFANDGDVDRDLSDGFRSAFPPIHNALDARPSALIEATDPRATNALEALKTAGYWVSPVPVPDAVLANIMPVFEDFAHSASGREMVDEASLMQNHQIMHLWIDSFFLKIAEQFLESAPILDFVVGMITNAGETDGVKMSRDAMCFHSDKDRIRWLKAFIYLDDVGPDNGPHTYIAGSQHHRLIARDGRYTDAEVRSVAPPESEQVITGPRGTFFLADTSCLHKGTIVRAGLRRVLQFEWANSLFGAAIRKVPMAVYRQHGVSTAFVDKYPRLFQRFV